MLEAVWRAFTNSLLDLNFLYYTMGLVSILGLSLAAALLVRGGRIAAESRFARHVERMRGALPAVIVLSLTTIAAGMQGGLEHQVQAWHGWDFTHIAWQIEGNLTERIQDAMRHPALDVLLVTVYTAGAFLLYFTPFFVLVGMGRGRNAMRIAATMACIWAVGIVAYFLLPVYEVWTTADPRYPYGWTHVENILFEHIPSARDSPAYLTALNNNFPSLHTALSSGIAAALWFGREKWLAIPSTLVAAGVAVATIYLGIHWVIDMVAGLILAVGAAWLVHRRVAVEATQVDLWRRLRRRLRSSNAPPAGEVADETP